MASRDLTTNFIERRSAANLRRNSSQQNSNGLRGRKPFGASIQKNICWNVSLDQLLQQKQTNDGTAMGERTDELD